MVRQYDFREHVRDEVDHSGETYGKLTILSKEPQAKNGVRGYAVKCNVCGTVVHHMTLSTVKAEANTKCIHLQLGKYKANWSHKQLRMKYTAMINRCYDPTCNSYYNYGGRGITVCNEWKNNPQSFNDWAITNGFEPGLSIDRIDNDKGYSPDNCRWVTESFNILHRRDVNWLKVDGVENTLADWGRMFGYNRKFFYSYYKQHGKKATKEYIREHIEANRRLISERIRHKFDINGVQMSVDQTTKYLGLNKTYLGHYIRKHGIDKAREYVAKLVSTKSVDDDPLVIKFGGK